MKQTLHHTDMEGCMRRQRLHRGGILFLATGGNLGTLTQHGQNKYAPSESSPQGRDKVEDDDEDLNLPDSLGVASNVLTKRNPILQHTEYLDARPDKRGGSPLLPDDAYSDLRYDPSWRTNMKGTGRFIESSALFCEGYCQLAQSDNNRRGPGKKGGYRYIVDTSPPVVTPHTAGSMSDQPFRLHPEGGLTSATASHHSHMHSCQSRSPEAHLSEASTQEENVHRLQGGIGRNHSCDGEHFSGSPNKRGDPQDTEFKMHDQQLKCTQGGPIQKMVPFALPNPKVSSNNKPQSLVEDKVELNKITLGCRTSKYCSYAKMHARKPMPNINEVQETLKMPRPAENQQHRSPDPELRLLQNTQQLWVTQISNGKKGQHKEYPNPSRKQPPAVAVKAELGDCLSVPLAEAAAVTRPEPQKTTSSQPLPPTIDRHTSSRHLSLLQQEDGQDAIINLASLHGLPHCSYLLQLALPEGYPQKRNHRKSSFISRKVQNTQLFCQNRECSPEQPQRSLPTTPTTASSQDSGSYSVLPPIAKPPTGEEPELSPCQSENTIHSGNPDSYLVQMEKQKQLAIICKKMNRQKLCSNGNRKQNKKKSWILRPEESSNNRARIKALEYAKTIAKPSVKTQPKPRQKTETGDFMEHAYHLQGSDVSLLATLEVLKKRHEEEKQTVVLFRKEHAV